MAVRRAAGSADADRARDRVDRVVERLALLFHHPERALGLAGARQPFGRLDGRRQLFEQPVDLLGCLRELARVVRFRADVFSPRHNERIARFVVF